MRVYREQDVAFFYRSRERFGELGNTCGGFPILYGNRTWKSTEALYQSLRYPGRSDLHRQINAETSGVLAKRKAYEFIDLTRSDWNDVKVPIMEQVVRLKVRQHWVAMCALLDQTLDMDIVEKSKKDSFWGAKPDGNGHLVGENVLGLIWMILREEIRAGEFHCNVFLDL